MKYTVVWAPDAERELAQLWNDAADRDAIADAADVLDRDLARDPAQVGESRPSGLRIAHCLPWEFGLPFLKTTVSFVS